MEWEALRIVKIGIAANPRRIRTWTSAGARIRLLARADGASRIGTVEADLLTWAATRWTSAASFVAARVPAIGRYDGATECFLYGDADDYWRDLRWAEELLRERAGIIVVSDPEIAWLAEAIDA